MLASAFEFTSEGLTETQALLASQNFFGKITLFDKQKKRLFAEITKDKIEFFLGSDASVSRPVTRLDVDATRKHPRGLIETVRGAAADLEGSSLAQDVI